MRVDVLLHLKAKGMRVKSGSGILFVLTAEANMPRNFARKPPYLSAVVAQLGQCCEAILTALITVYLLRLRAVVCITLHYIILHYFIIYKLCSMVAL